MHLGKRFYCDQCEFSATQLGGIKRHKQNFHGEAKVPCPHCNYQGAQMSDVKRHMRKTHEANKEPMICPYCNFQAYTQPKLT